MANYYDKVLEDFDISRESEGIFDDSYDEGNWDEGFFDRRKRPVKIPSSIGMASNFGRNVNNTGSSQSQGNYATKTELKNSLNSISEQVNDLKKSNLSLAGSIKGLNEGYEKVVKSIAKKDRSQDSIMSSSTMMSLLGTIVNKPTLNADALIIEQDPNSSSKQIIKVDPTKDPIQVDLTKTLLFTMMPMMMSGGSGGSSGNNGMMMMLPMVLLLGNKSGTGSAIGSGDNTLVLMMVMM